MERRFHLVLPPSPSPFPDLNQASDELASLREQHGQVGWEIDQRILKKGDAEHADLEDQAKAVRTGAKDPGWKRRDLVDKEISDLQGKMAALALAIENVQSEILALVEANQEEWIAQVTNAATEAREAYTEALLAAEESNVAVRETDALLRWVRSFPNVKSYKVPAGMLSLMGQGGDAYSVPSAFAALKEEAAFVPDFSAAMAGPPAAAPGPRTQEEARDLVEADRRRRVEMGYEIPPRKGGGGIGQGLPPNSVIGGREIG